MREPTGGDASHRDDEKTESANQVTEMISICQFFAGNTEHLYICDIHVSFLPRWEAIAQCVTQEL